VNRKRILDLFKTFEKNEEWVNANYSELSKKYANKVIAVKDQKVILVKDNIDEILKELELKGESLENVYVTSILSEAIAFIL